MNLLSAVLALTVVSVIIVFLLDQQQKNCTSVFQAAYQRSQVTSRPLIVIGDPHNQLYIKLFNKPYGVGDILIDTNPCAQCIMLQGTRSGPINKSIQTLPTDKYVVFVNASCDLELVAKIAGDAANVFVV